MESPSTFLPTILGNSSLRYDTPLDLVCSKLALSVYILCVVQVPSRSTTGDLRENLEQFKTEVPVLGLLGTPVAIEHTSKFSITSDVQLVCKYLKAFETKRIDKLYRERMLFHVSITFGNSKAIIHCFTGNFFQPKPCHVSYLFSLNSDLCTINSCLFEEGCICICLCLKTVGLVSQARCFLFRSADRYQYSYPIRGTAAETERV